MIDDDFSHYFKATQELSAAGTVMQEKLKKIEDRCMQVASVRRGGMDADAFAEEILQIITENA